MDLASRCRRRRASRTRDAEAEDELAWRVAARARVLRHLERALAVAYGERAATAVVVGHAAVLLVFYTLAFALSAVVIRSTNEPCWLASRAEVCTVFAVVLVGAGAVAVTPHLREEIWGSNVPARTLARRERFDWGFMVANEVVRVGLTVWGLVVLVPLQGTCGTWTTFYSLTLGFLAASMLRAVATAIHTAILFRLFRLVRTGQLVSGPDAARAAIRALDWVDADPNDPCPICFDEVSTARLRRTTCGHHAHEGCFASWCALSPTCPVCRQPILVGGEGTVNPSDADARKRARSREFVLVKARLGPASSSRAGAPGPGAGPGPEARGALSPALSAGATSESLGEGQSSSSSAQSP